jgi:hypothetical protein
VNKEILSTDTWYQLMKDTFEYCFDFTNSKLTQFKDIQSKQNAGLVDNCMPIVWTLETCLMNYLNRVSNS